jgi:hypothetical protein
MKKKIYLLLTGLSAMLLIYSCQKKESAAPETKSSKVSAEVLKAVSKMGFKTDDVYAFMDGYIVEGDIYIPKSALGTEGRSVDMVIAKAEQYRTYNVVTALPRTITVSVSSSLPTVYATATANAVARYNALGLKITFQIVASNGNIQLTGFNQGPSGGYITLGYSGFPTTAGNQFNAIGMNTNSLAYGTNPNLGYLTSVIQHEMGHCIGFRHTDYYDRSYSCGGGTVNEGNTYNPGDVQNAPGAIQIPGTPSAADANSFMLACSNGTDRTFNANDLIALSYLYGYPPAAPTVNINGKTNIWWETNGSASGNINAPANTLVHLTVSAYGPGTTTQCSISGATLSTSPGNYVYIQNNTITQTFTMPASGSVTWSGYFSKTAQASAGSTGGISVY